MIMKLFKNRFDKLSLLVLFILIGCGRFPGFGGRDILPSEGPELVGRGVRFSVYSTEAKEVAIAGSFNNWSKSVDLLSLTDEKGLWEITIPLSPGRYEYKFVVDGEKWIPDPGNLKTVDDGFGGINSVVIVPGRKDE